jgi:anti-sigma regulatory factor (Ser/Thr protein kinase)
MNGQHRATGGKSLLVATRLQPNAGAVSRARAAIDRLELPVQYLERGFDLRLLVSELVANAIKHAGGGGDDASILLSVEQVGTTLHVAVEDAGPLFTPAPTERPAADATSGRGLYLLTALADRWGIERRHGNRAWFELDLAAPPSSRRVSTLRCRGRRHG